MKTISDHQKLVNIKIDNIAKDFVTDEVIAFVKSSTTYSRIIKSNDPIEFMDIPLIQWDTCTSGIMCIVRNEMRKHKIALTHNLLIRICKLAARKILADK